MRAELKAAVERLLSTDTVVIADSMNYIKGFRYELFCTIKLYKTPHCVIHTATSANTCKQWNASRPEPERFSDQLMDELIMRFECPDSTNRWDKPLFTLEPEERLPIEEIKAALFDVKAPKQNVSTMAEPVASIAACGSRCAPPTGSGTIPSMMPNLSKSWAVIFILVAASGARAESRHRIEADASGEATV